MNQQVCNKRTEFSLCFSIISIYCKKIGFCFGYNLFIRSKSLSWEPFSEVCEKVKSQFDEFGVCLYFYHRFRLPLKRCIILVKGHFFKGNRLGHVSVAIDCLAFSKAVPCAFQNKDVITKSSVTSYVAIELECTRRSKIRPLLHSSS